MKLKFSRMLATLAVAMLCAAGSVSAAGLAVGDDAPEFSLPGSDGKTHTSADLEGKVVVIAWFPKAFTGG